MSKKTIYMVSAGEYSDYRIECAFDNDKDAEAFAALNRERRVEELVVYDEVPAPTEYFYARSVYVDGIGYREMSIDRRKVYEHEVGSVYLPGERIPGVRPFVDGVKVAGTYRYIVGVGTDQTALVKAMTDKIAKYSYQMEQFGGDGPAN